MSDRLKHNTQQSLVQKGVFWCHPKLQVLLGSYDMQDSNAVELHQLGLRAILDYILRCFCLLSIQVACYDNPASAFLWTKENVLMNLNLWQTPSEGIVVELKLRRGWKGTFQKYVRCILDAAGGDFLSAECMQQSGEVSCVHLIKAEQIIGGKPDESIEHEMTASLNVVLGLLNKEQPEAAVLALETLCVLCDPRRMGVVMSIMACLAVLVGTLPGKGDDVPFLAILDVLLSILKEHALSGFSWEQMSSLVPHTYLLLSLVLNVLCYALELLVTLETAGLASDHENVSATAIVSSFLAYALETSNVDIVRLLLDLLAKAETAPYFACLSAKCLTYICIACDDVRQRVMKLDAVETVNTAHQLGMSYHSNLERACARLQLVLAATE